MTFNNIAPMKLREKLNIINYCINKFSKLANICIKDGNSQEISIRKAEFHQTVHFASFSCVYKKSTNNNFIHIDCRHSMSCRHFASENDGLQIGDFLPQKRLSKKY